MTDTPKRIYAWAVPPTSNLVGTWCATRYPDAAEAYILASDHDRIVAEKDAEITRLREALLEIEGGASPDHWVPQFQHCVDVAREALKGDSDE